MRKLLILVLLLHGCGASIGQITAHPERYDDQVVTVSGRVTEVIALPFMDKGMFKLEDGTGSIWVLSSRRAPSRGEKLTVRGKVQVGLKVAGRTFGVVLVEAP